MGLGIDFQSLCSREMPMTGQLKLEMCKRKKSKYFHVKYYTGAILNIRKNETMEGYENRAG